MSKSILIIRRFDDFSRFLKENKFEIINLPLIETKLVEDLSEWEAKLENLGTYDGLFLTSQNAARILADKLRERNLNFAGRVYILGEKSFEILKDVNLDLIYDKAANTAREMLENIAPDELADKRFLFIRGEKSLRTVPDFLANAGAALDEIIVYKTCEIAGEIDKTNALCEKIARKEIAAACFFSPSGAESFIKQFGAEVLHQTLIATIGKTTAEFFKRQNLTVDFVSSKANAKDFAVELIKFLKEYLPAKHTKVTKRRRKL